MPRQMHRMRYLLLLLAFVAAACLGCLRAAEHMVGDSIWTIPPSNEFYTNWSRNSSFVAGDALVFRFETGFYNVMQVSKREFDSCSAENPFQTFMEGPVAVPLNEERMYYFICSFGNYCRLGQRVSVSVQRRP